LCQRSTAPTSRIHSIRAVEAWRLGSKEAYDGIPLVVTKAAKKMHFDVGGWPWGSTSLSSSMVLAARFISFVILVSRLLDVAGGGTRDDGFSSGGGRFGGGGDSLKYLRCADAI
jgi:uncharacterized membrane protein YgcG